MTYFKLKNSPVITFSRFWDIASSKCLQQRVNCNISHVYVEIISTLDYPSRTLLFEDISQRKLCAQYRTNCRFGFEASRQTSMSCVGS